MAMTLAMCPPLPLTRPRSRRQGLAEVGMLPTSQLRSKLPHTLPEQIRRPC
jgi:hypothetical protein